MKYMALLTIDTHEEVENLNSMKNDEIMFSKLVPVDEIYLDTIVKTADIFNLNRGEVREVFKSLGGL